MSQTIQPRAKGIGSPRLEHERHQGRLDLDYPSLRHDHDKLPSHKVLHRIFVRCLSTARQVLAEANRCIEIGSRGNEGPGLRLSPTHADPEPPSTHCAAYRLDATLAQESLSKTHKMIASRMITSPRNVTFDRTAERRSNIQPQQRPSTPPVEPLMRQLLPSPHSASSGARARRMAPCAGRWRSSESALPRETKEAKVL